MFDFLRIKNRDQILSNWVMRVLIGILGISLPFILWIGGFIFFHPGLHLQESISFYYHTNMQDFLVGMLLVMAMILVSYQGHELIDRIVTLLCGLAAIGIAFFPCNPKDPAITYIGIFQVDPKISDILHIICAAVFFTLLAINSLFLFTLSKKGAAKTKQKNRRNIVYYVCGGIMAVILVLILVLSLTIGMDEMGKRRISFLLESILLVSFGVSWLVKCGKIPLFRDRP